MEKGSSQGTTITIDEEGANDSKTRGKGRRRKEEGGRKEREGHAR